jgi:hypothetical protein
MTMGLGSGSLDQVLLASAILVAQAQITWASLGRHLGGHPVRGRYLLAGSIRRRTHDRHLLPRARNVQWWRQRDHPDSAAPSVARESVSVISLGLQVLRHRYGQDHFVRSLDHLDCQHLD